MILGVVCFATILVAASIIFTSATWTNTVSSGPGSVTKESAGAGTDLPSNPAVENAYTFALKVHSNVDTSTGSVVITITDADIDAANVTLAYDSDGDHSFATTLTPVDGGDVLTFTIGGTLAWSASTDYTYDFQITYNEAGSYACDASANATT